MTSLSLYIIKEFVGRFSGQSAFSPCLIVHCSFSTVTSISPSRASTLVLPESKHATVAIVFWFSRMYLQAFSLVLLNVNWLMVTGEVSEEPAVAEEMLFSPI